MIVITGAGGKTGRAVVRALAKLGEPVRALIRRPEQSEPLRALGALETVVGDLSDSASLAAVMEGAGACYHICPNVHPDEIAIGAGVIEAATLAGTERMIFHSVLHPQTRAMPHHWAKLQVEEKLFESNLDFVILQPCAYMQNIEAQWESISESGIYSVPYGLSTRISIVDLEDVAQIAALALTEPDHAGATYEICGPEALSQIEVAEILSVRIGRPVEPVVEPIEKWIERARGAGLAETAVSTLSQMFRYYDLHGFWGSPRAAETLLQRPPASFEQYLERYLSAI